MACADAVQRVTELALDPAVADGVACRGQCRDDGHAAAVQVGQRAGKARRADLAVQHADHRRVQDEAVPLAADLRLCQQELAAKDDERRHDEQHRPVGTDKVADVKQQLGQERQGLHLVKHRFELRQNKGHQNRNNADDQHGQDNGVHHAVADLLVHLVLALIVGRHAGAGVVDAAGALGAADHGQQQGGERGCAGLHRIGQRHALAQLAQDGLVQGLLAGVDGALVRHDAERTHQRHTGSQQGAQVAAEIRQHGGFQRAERRVGLLGLLRVGHVQAVIAQLGVERLLAGGLKQSADGLALLIGGSITKTWHEGDSSENRLKTFRLSKNSCRGEHCSPAPVCFVRQLSRKKRCCGKLTGDQWSPLHTQ